jgi:hypothetical protein
VKKIVELGPTTFDRDEKYCSGFHNGKGYGLRKYPEISFSCLQTFELPKFGNCLCLVLGLVSKGSLFNLCIQKCLEFAGVSPPIIDNYKSFMTIKIKAFPYFLNSFSIPRAIDKY